MSSCTTSPRSLGIAEATSKVSDEFGRVSGRRIGEAIDAHVVPSTNATTDISTASAIGTSLELSRDDHEHELPIDNTLEFNASDELSVNVQDVIEHLQERIQYHTSSSNYSSERRRNRWASLCDQRISQDHHQG